jgi:hypothetical protein
MANNQATTAPVPFFEDTRTLAEKLNSQQRKWMPHKDEGPSMIFGLVLERGTYFSDYYDNDGKRKEHCTARVLDATANIEWSVIGFPGYLDSEFRRKDPHVGDFVGAVYKGVVPAKKKGQSDAYDFQMEVERNPNAPLIEEPAEAPSADAVPEPGGTQSPDGDGDIPF